jgi:hypothetical protein
LVNRITDGAIWQIALQMARFGKSHYRWRDLPNRITDGAICQIALQMARFAKSRYKCGKVRQLTLGKLGDWRVWRGGGNPGGLLGNNNQNNARAAYRNNNTPDNRNNNAGFRVVCRLTPCTFSFLFCCGRQPRRAAPAIYCLNLLSESVHEIMPAKRPFPPGYHRQTSRKPKRSDWYTDYHDTIHAVCDLLTRDLTAEERTQYGILDNEPTCPGK